MLILDADHQGEILVFLADFHTYIRSAWDCGEITDEDAMNACYLLGNLEGRTIGNRLDKKDMEVIDSWKEELEEWKADHDGQIVVIPLDREEEDDDEFSMFDDDGFLDMEEREKDVNEELLEDNLHHWVD